MGVPQRVQEFGGKETEGDLIETLLVVTPKIFRFLCSYVFHIFVAL